MGKSPIIEQKWLEWKIGFQCEGMQIEKIPSISRKLKHGECLQRETLTAKSICDFASHSRRQSSVRIRLVDSFIYRFTPARQRIATAIDIASQSWNKTRNTSALKHYIQLIFSRAPYRHAIFQRVAIHISEQYFSSRFLRSAHRKNKIGNHNER